MPFKLQDNLREVVGDGGDRGKAGAKQGREVTARKPRQGQGQGQRLRDKVRGQEVGPNVKVKGQR